MIGKSVIVGLCAALALGACSTADDKTDDKKEGMPLTAHVVTSLVGFTADGRPQVQDVAEFAEAHAHEVDDLTARGMVRGVTVAFAPADGSEGHGFSVAEEFATAAEAQAEADRLYAANAEPPPGIMFDELDVPGIPGAQAYVMSGKMGPGDVTAVEIVFVDGVVVHELFALAADPLVSSDAQIGIAEKLFAAIAGHPLKAAK